jgi:hypothetical protein
MTITIQETIDRYRSKGALIDTNLLYVFFVGTVNRAQIGHAPHTDGYSIDDFDLLSSLLKQFRRRYVTPNVLTEVSNLAGKLKGDYRRAVLAMIRKGFDQFEEEYVPTRIAAQRPELERFGLTDAVLMELSTKRLLLLTADGPLADYCRAKGGDAINFTHLRPLQR